MTSPTNKLPPGLASSADLERVIARLTAILEEECGDNLGAWGAISMVLLTIICDISGADITEVTEALKRGDKGILQ